MSFLAVCLIQYLCFVEDLFHLCSTQQSPVWRHIIVFPCFKGKVGIHCIKCVIFVCLYPSDNGNCVVCTSLLLWIMQWKNWGQKKARDSLGLELQIADSCHIGAGNWTKSSVRTSILNYWVNYPGCPGVNFCIILMLYYTFPVCFGKNTVQDFNYLIYLRICSHLSFWTSSY